MAKMIQLPYDNHITLPIATAQAVQKERENPISLEALGLLTNLLSYSSTWELHKTELYKRFAHHGERSVRTAWKNLVDANYIIEFRYRVGKKYEYVYYFRKVPFTEEEKTIILETAKEEYGQIFGLCKMETPNGRDNKNNILNKKNINNNLKDIVNKEEEPVTNSDINLINDLETTKKEEPKLTLEQELIDSCNKNYAKFASGRWTKKQFQAIVKNFVEQTLKEQRQIKNVQAYVYVSLERIAKHHDRKFNKNELEIDIKNGVPSVNWFSN